MTQVPDDSPRDAAPLLLTVTPNPSVDLLFEAGELVWDDANRVPQPRRRAGGQGINAARAARVLGGRALPLALLGGAAGAEIAALLDAEGQALRAVPIEGETRVFVAARERATGRSLLLNPRGPHCLPTDGERLLAAVDAALDEAGAAWVACCGSVPPGLGTALYARIARRVHERGSRVVVDADGELLRGAVEAGCDLLVPNEHEAARVVGFPAHALPDAARAAQGLRTMARSAACAVTLGERGAVLASAAGAWHAVAPAHPEGSAVGAGDAFLAALLLALQEPCPEPEALRRAVAAGTAVLKSENGDLLTLEEYRRLLHQVEVREIG